ncbi:MAG TPA: beta-ketoacyl-ACP synthase II [Candidatus Acidoferrales bacterium]|nr:beta-ketoacyl-ACP synthase II [Candidatus Acidoferrales bacterium]
MKPTDRRVVVTGIGLVTPLGNDAAGNWQALLAGRSGIAPISRFDAANLPVRIAGEVRDFDPAAYIEKKEIKKMDAFTHYAVAAAQMAADDAQLVVDAANAERVGVLIGVGMGGIATIEEYHRNFLESGLKKVTPFFIPRLIANMAPAQIAMRFGAKGANYTTASACASGGHAVGEAYRLIRFGYQDAMFAGGAEAGVTPMTVGGFAVMRALSTRNAQPQRASRPFDRERDGFVVAEGAGVLILEDLDHARSRGARVYAEIVGYGANSDAYHITTPAPEGEGAAACMRLALADGSIEPSEVDYINAHGTSTPYNDLNETLAVKRAFGEHARRLAVSSTKSMTGHLLGAAGGVEAAYTALAVSHGVLPPTINYENVDPECDLDYVPNQPRTAPVRVALSNSFGFGGTNACVAFRRYALPIAPS